MFRLGSMPTSYHLTYKKTHYMLFSNTIKVLPNHVKIENTELTQVDCTKGLGLYIDSDLSWKSHINYLSKVLSKNTRILNKLKHIFPTQILLIIYSTLITPYLNYGILVWGNATQNLLDVLYHVQKRAIRTLIMPGIYPILTPYSVITEFSK